MKVRYIIYCALIALAVFSASASADGDIVIIGDANSDGSITTSDSMLALRMAVGGMAPDIARADVNYDGNVNSLDALMILKMAQESPKTRVCVDAPEVVSGAFDVTIEVCNVLNLDSGQFDLSFDPNVVNVTGVNSGSIGGVEVPIGMWRLMDVGSVRVLFHLPGATGVSGSGSLATIHFEVTGTTGDASVLNISDGLLVDTGSDKISALWNDCKLRINAPVIVNAPEIVSGTFDVTIDVANVTNLDSGQFDLWFDSGVVNVIGVDSGNIGSTVIPVGNWTVMHGTDNWDCDKLVRIIFDIPEVTGVSGSGSLATIHFEVTGTTGDASVLDISDGLLANTESDEILMLWNDCEVTVGTPVIVNAPETVSGTFDVTIDVANVTNLDSGQFDLSFNASVVNVTSVDSGVIGATEVRLDGWAFRDSDTVRVIFNLPGATGVSGSGSLATIHFEVTGTTGDASVLNISDGLLVNTESGKILAAWINDGVDV